MRLVFAAAILATCAGSPGSYSNLTLSTGATLSVLMMGPTDAPPVLFLHGFPEGSWSWYAVMAQPDLANFRLIAPDLRGYNRSSHSPNGVAGYAASQLAADVVALIGVVGAPVRLVAHDWGGALAWWVAAASPELLVSLTVINMAHPLGWITGVRSNPVQQAASAYVLQFVNPAFTEVLVANHCAALRESFAGDAWFHENDCAAAYTGSWAVPGCVDAGLDWYRENIRPNCSLSCTDAACWNQGVTSAFDDIPNNGITAKGLPEQVLWGMQDDAFDNVYQLNFIRTMVRGALNVTEYPNNSHWLAQEQPVAVAMQLAAFFMESKI